MNKENHIDGDSLAKANWTVNNPEKVLSAKIIKAAIKRGYNEHEIIELSGIIQAAIEDYKQVRENAMKVINDHDISKWIDSTSKTKAA